jgi:hypothetical protein
MVTANRNPQSPTQNVQLPKCSSTFYYLNALIQCRDNFVEMSNQLRILNCGRMKMEMQIYVDD